MKKYKLIKTYPGSPSLYTVRSNYTTGDFTNYPEFWQEIPEPYTVLSSVCDIVLKIKRNSDGVEFTVGDMITGFTYTEPKKIIGIDITGEYFKTEPGNQTEIRDAKKAIILFVTYDGVNIYANIPTYYCNLNTMTGEIQETNTSPANPYLSGKLSAPKYLYFSTKAKALEYWDIFKPLKPMFTSEEGTQMYLGDTMFTVYDGTYSNQKFAWKAREWKVDAVTERMLHVKGVHIFANKIRANKFIRNNMPKYSLNDISSHFGSAIAEYFERCIKTGLENEKKINSVFDIYDGNFNQIN